MTVKRLKILYDASILVDGEFDNGCRSGIYFVALNILKELMKKDELEIVLFSTPSKSDGLAYILRSRFKSLKSVYSENMLSRIFFLIITFIRNRRRLSLHKPLVRKFFSLAELIFEPFYTILFLLTTFSLHKQRFDVFFSPLTAPPWYIRCQRKMKKYVILYDIIPLKVDAYSAQKKRSWFGHLVRHLNSRDNYFAISQATKDDFCRNFSCIDPKKVNVVPLAANEQFLPIRNNERMDVVKKKYNIPQNKRYVFSLCALEPRKNLIRAVRTFVNFVEKNEVKDMVFVLGGGGWKAFSEKIKAGLGNPGLFEKYVVKAGYVDDEDLPVLYSYAEWFVYTSQYEGFGLPPLEAMQCGCPVITSNNSSLPEVVGDAGIMIDWDSDEQHIEAYEKYYFNEELRKENCRKGIERAKYFSWRKATDKIIRIIKS